MRPDVLASSLALAVLLGQFLPANDNRRAPRTTVSEGPRTLAHR